MTVTAGILSTSGTSYVVFGDVLQHVWSREAADLHDPAGATARLRESLRREVDLSAVSRRFRMRPDHGLYVGQFLPWGRWHAVVTAVTARQVWASAATQDEILAAGGVLPVALVGAELLAAIRAEAAEDAAATAPAAA